MALIPQDCPELEAFLSGIYKDLFDPSLMKKITINISKEEIDYIKVVREENPAMQLRVRREDKGYRFVIADAETEDKLIEDRLKDQESFKETEESPLEEYTTNMLQKA